MTTTETTRRAPKHGIELVALDLLIHNRNARDQDITPKYFRAVYSNVYKATAEIVHDMGYGATGFMIQDIVGDTYNEHNGDIDAAWPALADKLNAIKH